MWFNGCLEPVYSRRHFGNFQIGYWRRLPQPGCEVGNLDDFSRSALSQIYNSSETPVEQSSNLLTTPVSSRRVWQVSPRKLDDKPDLYNITRDLGRRRCFPSLPRK